MQDDETRSILESLARQLRSVSRTTRTTNQVTNVTNNYTRASGPTFISPVQFVTGETGSVAWTTYDASAVVPTTASAVIIQYRYTISGPDTGDVVADVYVRQDSSGDAYLVASGSSSGSADNNSSGGQGMYPCVNASFDYSIETPGFDGGIDLWVIGYWA